MAKINNNPLLKGLSGMLGDLIVYRETNGKMIMSNRPKKPAEPTDHQKQAKAKFLQAVQYAKGQMADPVAKAEYQNAVTRNLISAYAVALSDYLKGPDITNVDVTAYNGGLNQPILIEAIDNFRVTGVTVRIFASDNTLLEQGDAVQDPNNGIAWLYTTTVANAQLVGSRIVVSAKDKPNNVTEAEHIFE